MKHQKNLIPNFFTFNHQKWHLLDRKIYLKLKCFHVSETKLLLISCFTLEYIWKICLECFLIELTGKGLEYMACYSLAVLARLVHTTGNSVLGIVVWDLGSSLLIQDILFRILSWCFSTQAILFHVPYGLNISITKLNSSSRIWRWQF